MTRQKSPHTTTQQNTRPEQSDLDAGERAYESDSPQDQAIYQRSDGAETGANRAPGEIAPRSIEQKTQPETEAHQGAARTRTPKGAQQGVTSRSSSEESERQKKVVSIRPDAQAGVNRSKKRTS